MRKEFGKWLMDIAKYIATAVILSSVFGEIDSWLLYTVGAFSIVIILFWGLFLVSGSSVNDIKIKIKKLWAR